MEKELKSRNYQAPTIEICFVKTECNIAAGSIVRDNPDPLITEWQEVETVDIWNF